MASQPGADARETLTTLRDWGLKLGAIFQAALEALGVAPACAAYVGDRLHADVGGAQAVGMKGILIEVAHRVEDAPDITPDARIKELPELLGVLLDFR